MINKTELVLICYESWVEVKQVKYQIATVLASHLSLYGTQ